MQRVREVLTVLAMAACGSFLTYRPVHATGPAATAPSQSQQPKQEGTKGQNPPGTQRKLMVTVGKSLIIDSPLDIRRISLANADLAEVVAVNPREVLINGRQAGETALTLWQQNGARLIYELKVRAGGEGK